MRSRARWQETRIFLPRESRAITIMPGGMRSNRVEDVPELMQHIQSRLAIKEAACTSILSKSWLHAWSTNPTLRFCVYERKHLEVVDRTLNRYFQHNIPIECFDLDIDINNVESASFAEKWIQSVATKTCLKQLSISLALAGASLTLPHEILSVAKNLTKLEVRASQGIHSVWIKPPVNMVIKCLSLREVHFRALQMSQEVLDGMLSSCSLLENIHLCFYHKGINTIKIKNLPRLNELRVLSTHGYSTDLEISGVPNLRFFGIYFLECVRPDIRLFNGYPISLGSNVTELSLGSLITSNASLDMITSRFPLLQSLTLDIRMWTSESFLFTCPSLKRFSLACFPERLIDLHVYAPKLLCFVFHGCTMPSLLFPDSTLHEATFNLTPHTPLDASFFLKMREALTLSSNCEVSIRIDNYESTSDIDLNDLRTRLPFPPANNVQLLEFQMVEDEGLREHSPFFDAFFEICHPKHVSARPEVHSRQNNHFCRLMQREVLEKKKRTRRAYWTHYLKNVQIIYHKRWETLRHAHMSFINGPVGFKLNWR